jgi:hypothetical protein
MASNRQRLVLYESERREGKSQTCANLGFGAGIDPGLTNAQVESQLVARLPDQPC